MASAIDRKQQQQETREAVHKALAELAGASAAHESVASGIRNHEMSYYVKPEPASYQEMADIAAKAAEEERLVEPFVYTFRYRPWDCALALTRVCKQTYGATPTSIRGESAKIEVPIGPDETVTIPWGTVEFVPLKGKIEYETGGDPILGMVGQIIFHIPKKLHDTARGLCKLVEQDLATNSIYKGKAITSDPMPRFLDPYRATDRTTIVWTREVDAALRGSLVNIIRHPDRARERGLPIHRNVLFKGEPGNGKSETINILAQECMENGVTFIMSTTANLADALNLARTYAPAMVSLEDIERLVNDANANAIADLLEELDGASSKGMEIMLVATTNFVDDLRKTVRRRMAKEIEFGPFDADAAERFLEIRLRGQAVSDDMDYRLIAKEMDGWGNSYIAKVVEFATGLALEHESPELRTQDLLDAVAAQRPDWDSYQASKSRPEPKPLEEALKELVIGAVGSGAIMTDGDAVLVKVS